MTEIETIERRIVLKNQLINLTINEILELEGRKTDLQAKEREENKRIMGRLEAICTE